MLPVLLVPVLLVPALLIPILLVPVLLVPLLMVPVLLVPFFVVPVLLVPVPADADVAGCWYLLTQVGEGTSEAEKAGSGRKDAAGRCDRRTAPGYVPLAGVTESLTLALCMALHRQPWCGIAEGCCDIWRRRCMSHR